MTSAPGELQIHAVPRERQADALRMVFGHLGKPDSDQLVANLLAGAAADVLALAGLFEARRENRLVGAVWAQVQPGATACLWPPGLEAEEPESTSAALIESAAEYLQGERVRIAQALLPTGQDRNAARLLAAGFSHLSTLIYLVSMDTHFPAAAPRELDFETYSEFNAARFADVVQRTYEGTLDCPQLNGVRAMHDVLAGYRATGVFAPERWLLIRQQGRDVGCLILADHPGAGHWELVYMGLAPEARGRGLGIKVVRLAQWLARLAGCPRMVLAVDRANEPAIRMYTQAGFLSWNERDVFLRVFPSEA